MRILLFYRLYYNNKKKDIYDEGDLEGAVNTNTQWTGAKKAQRNFIQGKIKPLP
jgi:hypothetical protein